MPCSYPSQALTSLPSRRLAACIIAMSVELRKMGEAARCCPQSRQIAILSKDRHVASRDAWGRRLAPFEKVEVARARYLAVPEAERLINACEPDLSRAGARRAGNRLPLRGAGEVARGPRLQSRRLDARHPNKPGAF